MKTKRLKAAVLILIILLFQAGALNASVTIVDGTEFKNTFETSQTQLHIKGAGLLRYLLFIEAYAGAFYLPKGSDGSQAFDDIPKHLVLEYRVAISADDFAQATLDKIKESVAEDVFRRLAPKIESFNRFYKAVDVGDRYGLTYIPGVGTQLFLNDKLLGTIKGVEFANAVFAIWLGENPIDKGFRDRLLGNS